LEKAEGIKTRACPDRGNGISLRLRMKRNADEKVWEMVAKFSTASADRNESAKAESGGRPWDSPGAGTPKTVAEVTLRRNRAHWGEPTPVQTAGVLSVGGIPGESGKGRQCAGKRWDGNALGQVEREGGFAGKVVSVRKHTR